VVFLKKKVNKKAAVAMKEMSNLPSAQGEPRWPAVMGSRISQSQAAPGAAPPISERGVGGTVPAVRQPLD